MVEKLIAGFLVLIFAGATFASSDAVAGTAQIAQGQAEQDKRPAVEPDAERAKDDDREELLDAQTKARRDSQLKAEDSVREDNAADAQRRAIERKARIKALIER
ncbi:MAG: hypothetical protein HKN28_18360 [Alphaproteobacteria bacterium]|nr:hypothetical protein [Alphaproteobacteria bacterium]